MPYDTQWAIDNRVIETHVEQHISPDSKQAKDTLINQLLAQSEKQNAHVVLDCEGLYFPTFRSWTWIHNAHLGWVVMYGVSNPLTKFAINLGMHALGIRSKFVETYDEAIAFLQEVDITLPKQATIA